MTRKAAFFDLDGTLLVKPSSELRFLKYLYHQDYIRFEQIASGLLFYPAWVWRFGRDVGRKNKAFYHGLQAAKMEALATQWIDEYFHRLIDGEIVAQVELCRQEKYHLVLLTGAPEFLARPIAQQLRMDHVIATRLATHNGRFTAAPPLCHPLGIDKRQLAHSWCEERRVDLADCAAYGDSHQDSYLLQAVDKAVAVNPDRRLERLAANQRWLVLNTRQRQSQKGGPSSERKQPAPVVRTD